MLRRALQDGFAHQTWIKAIGHTVAITVFFMAYFHVAENPMFEVTTMPSLPLDDWTPLIASSVWIYFSLWVYICLPASLMTTGVLLWQYFLGSLVLAVAGLWIFLLWPTQTPDWPVDWSQQPAAIRFLKNEDLSRNACPSLHVAYALFAGCWLDMMLRRVRAGRGWRWGNVFWALAIIISTLTTKQHVVIDLVFGALLGGLIFAVNRNWVRRAESSTSAPR